MQYSVVGTDGNQYGPVDLATLQQWVKEGRVTPATQVIDGLSNQTMAASQIPELGISAPSNPYSNVPAPPANYGDYPRDDSQRFGVQGTRLWAIIFWLAVSVILSIFTTSGGMIISAWNIFDAFQARSRNDPKAGLCMVVGVGGFLLILLWTYIKYQARGSF